MLMKAMAEHFNVAHMYRRRRNVICVAVLLISLLSIGTRSIAHKVLCYTQSII